MDISVDFDSLIEFIDIKVFEQTHRHLRDVEVIVLNGVFEDKTYNELAEVGHYSVNYLRGDVGAKLFQLLSKIFETHQFTLKKIILEQYFHSSVTQVSEDGSI
jgi:hypothetical protein